MTEDSGYIQWTPELAELSNQMGFTGFSNIASHRSALADLKTVTLLKGEVGTGKRSFIQNYLIDFLKDQKKPSFDTFVYDVDGSGTVSAKQVSAQSAHSVAYGNLTEFLQSVILNTPVIISPLISIKVGDIFKGFKKYKTLIIFHGIGTNTEYDKAVSEIIITGIQKKNIKFILTGASSAMENFMGMVKLKLVESLQGRLNEFIMPTLSLKDLQSDITDFDEPKAIEFMKGLNKALSVFRLSPEQFITLTGGVFFRAKTFESLGTNKSALQIRPRLFMHSCEMHLYNAI